RRGRLGRGRGPVGRDGHGQPRKGLVLDQTDLSSGSSLRPYGQGTRCASLWLASVVNNGSQDGLLAMLNWLQAAGEPQFPKSMIRVWGAERFQLKPVGLAQQFIAQHCLHKVLWLENDGFEVDVLAIAGDDQRGLLGVNKGTRLQRVDLSGAKCPLNNGA
ncbi:hypothetical protein C3E98_041285, partial [Pseudomonas sp. MWU13-2625]